MHDVHISNQESACSPFIKERTEERGKSVRWPQSHFSLPALQLRQVAGRKQSIMHEKVSELFPIPPDEIGAGPPPFDQRLPLHRHRETLESTF
jgi:hypothetical protein